MIQKRNRVELLTRVSPEEKILLESKAQADGFTTMSEWIRYRLLQQYSTEERIISIERQISHIHDLLSQEKLKQQLKEV